MIREAREAAASAGEAERQKAVAEATSIVVKAREASEMERNRILGDLKRDFSRLVLDATAKATGKVLTPEDHARLNRDSLSQIANN
jgi:F-type H+-transporting ATPase subunit b